MMPANDMSSPSHDQIREYLHRQMLSSVSHDLKTPLATIIGSLEVMTLLDAKLSEDKRRALVSSALTEAFRLDYFITNILDMAKFEADAVRPRFESARLSQMIQDSLSRLGPLKTRGELEITQVGTQDEIVTDPMLGARAIGLVLHNAFKFGGRKAGKETPRVEVAYGMKDGYGFVRIRDHGEGIPDDQQVAVFDKYTRLQKSDQQAAGTGLGLTICQHIMRLLHGRIELTNHSEGGAVFTLIYSDNRKS
ncbi:histidine kinase-, DNA gyrase B-, and HSP90-like ATPase family protein [Asticcacaulis biprosthecium C19]|uniref:histidine kinase n=2 Tax=Asticcacaulis biprosthecium TaxID=76891 RepID=F4QMU4_9CAUL|nr:histidine kinase-, DNA gyrase B-, and HSP90-like ATPase family protein [Asticcacaulis biprosthecium C19]